MSATTDVPPANAAADVRLAWPAMCPPVRERYAATTGSNRWRDLALAWVRWEVHRRRSRTQDAPPAPLPVDARILAVQPDHLGGVLASTPAFRLLKAALPPAHLTVLAGPWGADVAEHCPVVDRVRTSVFPAFDRSPRPGGVFRRAAARLAPYERLLAEARALTTERYDVALVFAPDFWSCALVALAGVPRRLGFDSADGAPFLDSALPLDRPPIGADASDGEREHVAEAHLRLARATVALAGRVIPPEVDLCAWYEPRADEREAATRLWRARDLDEASDVVAIHAAPGGPAKRWPIERFALVADHISGRFGAKVIITGGPDDVDEARALAAACWHKPVVLAGQTSFGVLASVLERCRLVIGTDNGAMHLATARKVPTLRLYGPTDPRTWGAWTGGDTTVTAVAVASPRACAPCHRLDLAPWAMVAPGTGSAYPCMADIAVERVIAVIEDVWRATSDRR